MRFEVSLAHASARAMLSLCSLSQELHGSFSDLSEDMGWISMP